MASSSHRLPDIEELLSTQVDDALAFVNWAEEERTRRDNARMRLVHEFATDCYALALRHLSDHLLSTPTNGKDAA